MNEDDLRRAAEALAPASRLLVVTGAGVSAESGVPTFRGDGGLWEGFRPEELATPSAFAADPARVWRWYRWRRGVCLEAEPNPAHHAIAEMDRDVPEFLLTTQNVDGLHGRAGSRRMSELHGNINQGRCTGCSRIDALPEPVPPAEAPLPECAECGALIRPHIVWFGETYWPGVLEQAFAFSMRAEAVIVAGTSAQVWPPIAVALRAKEQGAFLIDVNPDTTEVSAAADVHLAAPAGEALADLWGLVREIRA